MVKTKRSLVQFAKDQRRKGCPVCALPAAIRAELAQAREKHIPRSIQLGWLVAEHGIKLTAAQFDSHNSGRHDQAA